MSLRYRAWRLFASVQAGAVRIRVGNAEARQDARFEMFHPLGLAVGFVVESDQVKIAVNRQMREMVDEKPCFPRPPRAPRSRRRWRCRRDAQSPRPQGRIARRKRQHIGRLVDPAPLRVHRADCRIVGEQHRDLAGFALAGAPRLRSRAARHLPRPACADQSADSTTMSISTGVLARFLSRSPASLVLA